MAKSRLAGHSKTCAICVCMHGYVIKITNTMKTNMRYLLVEYYIKLCRFHLPKMQTIGAQISIRSPRSSMMQWYLKRCGSEHVCVIFSQAICFSLSFFSSSLTGQACTRFIVGQEARQVVFL